MTMPELFTILEDFQEELSLKLTGMMGMFGGSVASEKETDSKTNNGVSTAEEVDAFFNDF